MSRRVPRLLALFLMTAAILAAPCRLAPARAAEIVVIANPMVVPALAELRVRFERQSGHRLLNRSNDAGGPRRFLERGAGFDIALLAAPLAREFAARGVFAQDSAVPLLRAPVAVAVRSGAPKPDIATPQALRSRLLIAKAYSYVPGGEAGPHIEKVIAELGLTEAVRGKAKTLPTVRQAIHAVASGEADLFFGLTSVIASAYGIELAGPLPPPLGHDFTITAAIGAKARDADATWAFARFLETAEARAIFQAAGFEPAVR